jgi:cytochrome P450
MNWLIADIAPSILAPKGNRARSALAEAFQLYFEEFIPGKTQCSAMTLARYSASTQNGITFENQGRLEAGTLLGVLANTIPAVFYMLIHVYSDSALLQDIRAELERTCVSTTSAPGERLIRHVHILRMREKCHLLYSTFQELLRVHALGASARFVREDIMLDDQHLLKKGMVVQMPTPVMHFDPTIWGADVKEFQPRRFLSKQNSKAYRPFGGGASWCPGRHFVTLETLALTACMVLRYDIASADGGPLRIPAQKQESLSTNFFPPEKDITVRVSERQDYENVTWNAVMS